MAEWPLVSTAVPPGSAGLTSERRGGLDSDYLELWIDGVKQNSISGETAWAAQSWWLAAGSHTVQRVYRKNSTGIAGSDAGWVDYLRLE
jgi:hypothetical protein